MKVRRNSDPDGRVHAELAPVLRKAERAPDSFERAWSSVQGMAQAFSLIGPELTQVLRTYATAKEERPEPVSVAEDGILILDEREIIESFNPIAEKIFGYNAAEAVGRHIGMLLTSATSDAGGLAVVASRRAAALSVRPDTVGRRRDGTRFSVEITSTDFKLGEQRRFIIVVRDLTEPNRLELERRKAEARYRTLIEQLPVVTAMAALDEDIHELYVSPQVEELLGFTQEQWLSDPVLWYHQIHPDDRDLLHEEFARGCATGGPFKAEFRALNRNGSVVWIHGEARVVRNEHGRPLFIQGVAYDISETKRAEEAMRAGAEQLKASLREKESLLKEIHHRVKNNLQVISSLLKLQAAGVRDGSALEMFHEGQNRIRSMALIHEKLYQSPDLSRVEFASYVRDLLSLLLRSYAARPHIELDTAIESAALSIELAVPLGLILNELISNCLKYAFPDGRAGRIRVELRPVDVTRLKLTVADDGVGFPAQVDFRTTETLGMQLVRTLTEQIGGDLELRRGAGTEFAISFPNRG
ncbi:MAG TPA: PAS domain S-box protein [Candidatus Binataceae bacterium]|nr:PAS domain S-box protein [Candidatus Binataceae bacterium]